MTVTDADAHYQRAKAAGAHVLGEPHDVGEGFRGYTATGVQMGIRYNGTVTGKWRRWAAPT